MPDLGSPTLEKISRMKNFNRWMYERIAPYIGERILEVGAGIGNLTQFFIDREFVLASDVEDSYLSALRDKFGARENFKTLKLDFMDDVKPVVKPHKIDTIVCLNVLEHILEDRAALRNMYEILIPGGNLIILVPAFQWLYGTMDKNLLHHRRYSKKELREKFETAGFNVIHTEWMNIAGIPGWFINGKIRKVDALPEKQLALYDKLVPIFRIFEKLTGPPIGQSIIMVGRKG
jgi:SAM-dependent methyltransferase